MSNGSCPAATRQTEPTAVLAEAAATTAVATNRRILSLPLHQWLETAQQSHGIPHHDYAQYHAYCTRRLSRLRHAKEVRKDLVHSSAYVSAAASGGGNKQTRRHAYVPRNIIPPPPTVSDDEEVAVADNDERKESNKTTATNTPKELHENVLWVLLVGAERAWAHAGELRARYTDGNNSNSNNSSALSLSLSQHNKKSKRSSPGQLRHHSLRRLKRAQQLAIQLEQVALQFSLENTNVDNNSSVVVLIDQRTVQECQAYANWMRGNWALEMADWKTACEAYRSAISICRTLSQLAQLAAEQASPSQGDETEGEEEDDNVVVGGLTVAESLELRDLFTTRAENMSPLLKYCQYEWREANGGVLPDNQDDTTLSVATTNAKTNVEGGGSVVSFRGKEIPIENKNLRVLLLKADGLLQQQQQQQHHESADSSDQDGRFATLLSTFDDAMSLVTQELKSYEGAKAGPAVNAKRRELELLSGYIQYEKLSATCRRLQALLPTLTEDAEIVHVYDALLQDARAILSLPSSSSASKEVVDNEEDEFWLQANANVLRIRAFRCFYLAKLYANGQQYGQAKALLKQSQLLSTRAMEEIAACDEDMVHGVEYMESLKQLQQHDLLAMTCRVQAQAYLSSSSAQGGCGASSRSFYNYNLHANGGVVGSGTNRSLLVRRADFDPGNGRRLADVPPDLLPLPCKPSFYDVAWNYASQFPDLDQVIDDKRQRKNNSSNSNNKQSTKTTASGSGGGLFGWLRG